MKTLPDEIIRAHARPKILVIWLHGDEKLGSKIGQHIVNERPDLLSHVDYVCGNIKAAKLTPAIRYIDTDLNRSFNPDGEPIGYEQIRAQEILSQAKSQSYDYVLDVHTSTVDVGRFFLVAGRNEAIDTMIAASPITRVVVMPEAIVKASLIGQINNSISIEYNRELADSDGVSETMQLIDGLIAGHTQAGAKEREFYYVTRPIPKTQDPGPSTKNFELTAAGYYPVLFGEAGYKQDPKAGYLGFAADRVEKVLL